MGEESGSNLQVLQCNESKSNVFKWCYFPELIQIEIFKKLDVKRLLLFRTICPAWNKTICEVLRHKVSIHLRPIFSYTKESKCMSKKLNPFVQNHYGKTQFKTYAIHAEGEATSKMKAKKIRQFLNDQAQKMEKICINSYYAQRSNIFNLFFDTGALTNNPSLTHLTLDAMNHLPTVSLNDQQLNLPALKYFNVTNQIEFETPNGFTAQVINGAPNLTHLYLLWYGNNSNLVSGLRFKNIKILKLSGYGFSHDDSLFPQIIRKVSGTIEELYTDADYFEKLGPAGIPTLPKLNTLKVFISWCLPPNTSEFEFSRFQTWLRQDNLPMLKNVGLNQLNHFEQNQLIPHIGVRNLCLRTSHRHMKDILPRCLGWFQNIRTKFPSINAIDFTWDGSIFMPYDALDQVIANLVQVFPGLESFALRTSELKPVLFTGVESEGLIELYRQEDWLDLEMIPRKTCIRDFPRLKTLVVEDQDGSLSSVIIRSISELPSLEILEFNWNPQLSVEDVVNHLGNLKVVSIGNCCRSILSIPINELFMRTKNVRCGCKNYKDAIGFFRRDYCENAVL